MGVGASSTANRATRERCRHESPCGCRKRVWVCDEQHRSSLRAVWCTSGRVEAGGFAVGLAANPPLGATAECITASEDVVVGFGSAVGWLEAAISGPHDLAVGVPLLVAQAGRSSRRLGVRGWGPAVTRGLKRRRRGSS